MNSPHPFRISRLQSLGYDLARLRPLAEPGSTDEILLIFEDGAEWVRERDAVVAKRNRPAAPAAKNDKPEPEPTPIEQWPFLARVVAAQRRDGEVGLGSTLKRMLGNVGAEVMTAWFKKITKYDCGCSDRMNRLNELFAYPKA